MKLNGMLIGATLAAALCACAGTDAFSARDGVVTSIDGRTLYVFAKDSPGKSNCNGACATAWPPYAAKEGERGSGAYTVIARDDGTRQWAHNGQPLYFYGADTKPGEAKGQGQGGVWSTVKAPAAQATMPARNDGGY